LNIEYGYVESAHLRNLKVVLANFMGNTEDPVATSDLEIELPKVLEIVEILKKSKSTP
jgi:murein tripeptide amidase MpaA